VWLQWAWSSTELSLQGFLTLEIWYKYRALTLPHSFPLPSLSCPSPTSVWIGSDLDLVSADVLTRGKPPARQQPTVGPSSPLPLGSCWEKGASILWTIAGPLQGTHVMGDQDPNLDAPHSSLLALLLVPSSAPDPGQPWPTPTPPVEVTLGTWFQTSSGFSSTPHLPLLHRKSIPCTALLHAWIE
jgi:hypothetical protein